jgi:hypothetical protein
VVTFSTIEQTMYDFVGGITSTTIGIGILLGIINFKHFVGGITSTTIGIGILLGIINLKHTCLSKFFVIDHSFYHSETIIFILTFP